MKYRINYSKVISQANEITNDAQQLSAQIQMIMQTEQECQTVWKGEAAEVFAAKLSALRSEMNRTMRQMSGLAETVKVCADIIKREDEEAARRASDLKSGH